MDKEFSITLKTLLLFVALVLCAFVVYKMSSIFGILGLSLLVSISLEQSIKFLVRRRVRRTFAVYSVYVLLVVVVVGIVTMVVPPLAREVTKFLENLPAIIQSMGDLSRFGVSASDLLPQVTRITSGIISVSYSVFSNIAVLITIFFLALYISLDLENIKPRLLALFPKEIEEQVEEIVYEVEVSVSQWLKGQSFLMLVVGLATLVGLSFIGVEYALALAVIAGFLEIVPMIGPVISAVIASAITFTQSPGKGILVVLLFIVVQQLENNLLVPRIMQKVSGFSPLVILIAVITFTNFFGVVGTVVAVPCVMIGFAIAKRFLNFTGSE
ncbi:TPA: hypothetical protein DCY43_02190 [candidate division WWE3 bacterium]|uniref:AI-2E family transporter n=3 Tax=Katanobacteria TaxID=422282 RepID=A0A0G1MVW2_UNCKA|nr:MAG: hypothetical protein UW65_C0030G0003 [candidate division WWE3 bacterium GW2011_GWB1_44_4]KKT84917.1 MAG: hypothetical protein UW82_C0006G0007 [candidate division WWE3 bacterium GW2011_GWC2_44_9]HAZ29541.1 hypothetical protein [candidate division WWE3 bacterium]